MLAGLSLLVSRRTARALPHSRQILRRNISYSSPTDVFIEQEAVDSSREPPPNLWEPDDDTASDLLNIPNDDADTTSLGHYIIDDQRDQINYMRLIEHDMPKLVAFRKSFVPPRASTPLIVRSLYYGGEKHPVEKKRSIVVAVDHLPLRDSAAVHYIKVLAGPRWSSEPPTNSGVSGLDVWNNGYIKIACEDFPTGAMNLKWASDTLDTLTAAANDPECNKLDRVPVDSRHIDARNRKKKKGGHRHTGHRPSILDFPAEWLPSEAAEDAGGY